MRVLWCFHRPIHFLLVLHSLPPVFRNRLHFVARDIADEDKENQVWTPDADKDETGTTSIQVAKLSMKHLWGRNLVDFLHGALASRLGGRSLLFGLLLGSLGILVDVQAE